MFRVRRLVRAAPNPRHSIGTRWRRCSQCGRISNSVLKQASGRLNQEHSPHIARTITKYVLSSRAVPLLLKTASRPSRFLREISSSHPLVGVVRGPFRKHCARVFLVVWPGGSVGSWWFF